MNETKRDGGWLQASGLAEYLPGCVLVWQENNVLV